MLLLRSQPVRKCPVELLYCLGLHEIVIARARISSADVLDVGAQHIVLVDELARCWRADEVHGGVLREGGSRREGDTGGHKHRTASASSVDGTNARTCRHRINLDGDVDSCRLR